MPAVSFPPAPIYSKLPSSCKSDDWEWLGEVTTNKLLHTNSWFKQRDLCPTMLCSEVSLQGSMGFLTQENNRSDDVGTVGAQAPLSVEGVDCHK